MTFRGMIELSSLHINPDDLREAIRLAGDEWQSCYVSAMGIVIQTSYCDSALCPPRLKHTLKQARDVDHIDYLMFNRYATVLTPRFKSYKEDWE